MYVDKNNAAKAFSIQLGVGEDYFLPNPVIVLTITDFEMFPDSDRLLLNYPVLENIHPNLGYLG